MPPPPPPPPTNCASFWKWAWYRTFHSCFGFHRPPHLKDQPLDWRVFLPVFAIKFLLEVCGAAGAVWGSSEVVKLRTSHNVLLFRNLAMVTFLIFLVRFYWHAKHWLEHEHDFPYVKIEHRRQHMIHFFQVFLAKFVLQVMGGAGAVWGSSDAVGLRTPATQEAWRTAAIIAGNLFFFRWFLEIMSYCLLFKRCTRLRNKAKKGDGDESETEDADENRVSLRTSLTDQMLVWLLKIVDWNECLTVKFVLEVCGACGATWGFSEILGLHTEYMKETVWRPVAWVTGAIFALRWFHQTAHVLFFDNRKEQHLVTEPMTLQKRSSVQLSRPDLHVSVSMRRLSTSVMGASMLALRALDLQDIDDMEDDSDDDSDVNIEKGEVKEEIVSSSTSLRLISTIDTKESYQSCDQGSK